uniref:Uncharacterized protein n=1 Tax=viral metagenome TaxID=1070528 RepID=A0A6M3LFY2_9ZZZZ
MNQQKQKLISYLEEIQTKYREMAELYKHHKFSKVFYEGKVEVICEIKQAILKEQIQIDWIKEK